MMENNVCITEKNRIKEAIVSVVILVALLIMAGTFMREANFNSRTLMYSIFVIVIINAILIVYICSKIEFYAFSFICVMFLGLLSLFIQPILNIPDEATHYARAEMISRGVFFVNPQEQTHETIQATYDLMDNSQKTYSVSTIQEMDINEDSATIEHVASANLSITYIPQALGIFIAKVLNLKLIWSMWLGRILNLLCYSLMIGLGIKLAGNCKFALFFVAALPMSIQQAASLSPDAIINGGIFLLIGYFIHLYTKDYISWKNIVIFSFLGLLVTFSKVTNVFFGGLILLLPIEKYWNKRKSMLVKISIILIFILCGGLFYIYTTQFPIPDVQKAYFDAAGVNSTEQIQYILTHTWEWIRNFGSSLVENCSLYVSMINNYGWLTYGYSISTIVMLVMFGKICFQQEGIDLPCLSKILLTLMVIGNYCFTCLALYITWTPVGSADIAGVQGRYFIPVIAVLTLLLSGKKQFTKGKESHKNDMIVILAMVGAMLIKTITYYY